MYNQEEYNALKFCEITIQIRNRRIKSVLKWCAGLLKAKIDASCRPLDTWRIQTKNRNLSYKNRLKYKLPVLDVPPCRMRYCEHSFNLWHCLSLQTKYRVFVAGCYNDIGRAWLKSFHFEFGRRIGTSLTPHLYRICMGWVCYLLLGTLSGLHRFPFIHSKWQKCRSSHQVIHSGADQYKTHHRDRDLHQSPCTELICLV
jgi:hypothetical protein